MYNQFMFTETLEENNGRIQEEILITKTGDIRVNSYFSGASNGKLYHFNEPGSKGKRVWKRQLFYFKPEIGAYCHIECRVNEWGNIFIYDNLTSGMAAVRYQRANNHRINQVFYNGVLQKLNKSKKYRCEACGLNSQTQWAHLVEGKALPVAELCMPCHRLYDLQGEGINFVDKAGK